MANCNEQLENENLKQVTGGSTTNSNYDFDNVTKLLRVAGDRAWTVLFPGNELWASINRAEKATSIETRKEAIDEALNVLKIMKSSLFSDDYNFIYDNLIKSKKNTKQ